MTLRSRLLRCALVSLAALAASATFADVYRPAYLELREVDADIGDALRRLGAAGDVDDAGLGDATLLPSALHGVTTAVNSIFNTWRFEDAWLDK